MNKRIQAAAARKGCKVQELPRDRDTWPSFELTPIAPHHHFAQIGPGIHAIPCYNSAAVAEELRTADPQPCPPDCECRDEEEETRKGWEQRGGA